MFVVLILLAHWPKVIPIHIGAMNVQGVDLGMSGACGIIPTIIVLLISNDLLILLDILLKIKK